MEENTYIRPVTVQLPGSIALPEETLPDLSSC